MERLHLMYAAAGTVALILALVSRAIRRLPLSEPLVALMLGVALGPELLGLLEVEPAVRDPLLLEGSRLLLAGSVMAAALRFPATDLRPLVRPLLVLLAIVMPLAAVLSGAAALLLGLPLALAALVGACLSPTDPVLAASVVSGGPAERDLPPHVRRLLTAESGANDGLALPLVGIALAAVRPQRLCPLRMSAAAGGNGPMQWLPRPDQSFRCRLGSRPFVYGVGGFTGRVRRHGGRNRRRRRGPALGAAGPRSVRPRGGSWGGTEGALPEPEVFGGSGSTSEAIAVAPDGTWVVTGG